MSQLLIRVVASLLLVQSSVGAVARAEGWPGWRGASRDGHAVGFTPPQVWPQELVRVWQVEIGGGYASPVSASGKIYLHSREGEEEVVSARDLADGKALWSRRYAAPYEKNSYALAHGKGPNATPLVHAGKVYTLGMSGILSSFEAATGELLWRRDFSPHVNSKKLFCGIASSPLIERGLVVTHVGDDSQGFLVALDAASGEEKWSWTGAGPGYASPIAIDLGGRRQIVTLTDRSAVGVAVEDGTLLWQLEFPDKWNENIVTPVFHREQVVLAGVRRGTLALRWAQNAGGGALEKEVSGTGAPEMGALETVWQRPDLTQYMSSPVADAGTLYGMSNKLKGHFFALDLATGKTLWTSDGRQGESATLVSAGETLLWLTTEGVLNVVKKSSRDFDLVATYQVAEGATWAHPLLIGNQLVIREKAALTLWRILDGPSARGAESLSESCPDAGRPCGQYRRSGNSPNLLRVAEGAVIENGVAPQVVPNRTR
ncbi:MAG: PQQ-binding-like beta-propeller repeat protein [Acidobacteriota bacterium]